MVEITEFYKTNEDFKTYVDKYALCHRTTVENALKTMMVKEVYLYYKDRAKKAR